VTFALRGPFVPDSPDSVAQGPLDEYYNSGVIPSHLPVQSSTRDMGESFEFLSRFKYLSVARGGTYKACYCDPTLAKTFGLCLSNADFKVTLGEVYVSGISCLLEREHLRHRASCIEQYWGGLRCFEPGEIYAPSYTPWHS